MITNLEDWELGDFVQRQTSAKLMKDIVAMIRIGIMINPFLQTMNVQAASNVDIEIVHPNLNCHIGWIVATSRNGKGAKTLWT